MTLTSDDLLTGVKERVSVPYSQALVTPAMVMRFADTVIRSRLVPLVESLDENFFVTSTDVATVAGQVSYAIPYRSIGRKLRELQLRDASGTVSNIPLVALEDARRGSRGAYFAGDRIVVPALEYGTGDDTLVMWWFSPPSSLCAVSDAALVSSVTAETVTTASVPTAVANATLVDFVQGRAGSAVYDFDVAPVSTTTTTVVFASAAVIPTELTAGDYIAAAGKSPVVNWLPNECQPLLETYCAKRVLEAIGDFEGAKVLEGDISTEEKNLKLLLEPRLDGEPKVIIDRTGLVRGRAMGRMAFAGAWRV